MCLEQLSDSKLIIAHDIDPNIYPYFDLYPSVILEGRPIYPKVLEPITVHPNYQYPTFNLCMFIK